MAFVSYEIKEARKKELKQKVIESKADNQKLTSKEDQESKLKEKRIGYQTWAFSGEFWRDELSSFEYNGRNLCTSEESDIGVKSDK